MAARKFLRGFVVAGGDGTELLELAEEVLDQVARFIELSVKVARRDGLAGAGSPRSCRRLPAARGRARRRRRPCRRSACRPPSAAAARRRRPDRGPVPAVSRKASGLPSASTRAWILVLSPPRLRPIAWSSSFFGRAGAVLVGAHDGAVDHRVFVVGARGEMLKHPLPHPAFGPTAEPEARGAVRAARSTRRADQRGRPRRPRRARGPAERRRRRRYRGSADSGEMRDSCARCSAVRSAARCGSTSCGTDSPAASRSPRASARRRRKNHASPTPRSRCATRAASA